MFRIIYSLIKLAKFVALDALQRVHVAIFQNTLRSFYTRITKMETSVISISQPFYVFIAQKNSGHQLEFHAPQPWKINKDVEC